MYFFNVGENIEQYFICAWPILHQTVAMFGQMKNWILFIWHEYNNFQSSNYWFEFNHVWNQNSWWPLCETKDKFICSMQYVMILMKSELQNRKNVFLNFNWILYTVFVLYRIICSSVWRIDAIPYVAVVYIAFPFKNFPVWMLQEYISIASYKQIRIRCVCVSPVHPSVSPVSPTGTRNSANVLCSEKQTLGFISKSIYLLNVARVRHAVLLNFFQSLFSRAEKKTKRRKTKLFLSFKFKQWKWVAINVRERDTYILIVESVSTNIYIYWHSNLKSFVFCFVFIFICSFLFVSALNINKYW